MNQTHHLIFDSSVQTLTMCMGCGALTWCVVCKDGEYCEQCFKCTE